MDAPGAALSALGNPQLAAIEREEGLLDGIADGSASLGRE